MQFFLIANASLVYAQVNSFSEGVICRTNRTLVQRGSEWTPLDGEVTMAGGIVVFTNGTYRINEGKERHLQEGQVLRTDGYLLNPDGSVTPVWDHIAMVGARVKVFKDGVGEKLAAPLTLTDGSVINPDGTYTRPSGRYSRLVDGQLLTLEGVAMDGLDAITFRNGRVIVYKGGTLIPLRSPMVIMGMDDGSRVRGDGLFTFPDGRTTSLTEGQTITVPGVRAEW